MKRYTRPKVEAVIIPTRTVIKPKEPVPEAITVLPYHENPCRADLNSFQRHHRDEVAKNFSFKRKGFKKHQR